MSHHSLKIHQPTSRFALSSKYSLLGTALSMAIVLQGCQSTDSANEEQPPTAKAPKHVILMVSDGIGFNGWLAADYYQGKSGKQSYQITRPDGTQPRVYGLAHNALNLIDEHGELLGRGADVADAAGAVEQGYDPMTRWLQFDNAMINDFTAAGSYTSYTDSAAAGTALMSGIKTSNGRLNMSWDSTQSFTPITQFAQAAGMATGVVSSVMISHATPAAAVATNISRNNYADIFQQMVNAELTVLMGAGHPLFNGSGQLLPEDKRDYQYLGGEQTFDALTAETGLNGYTFIDDKRDFMALAQGQNLPDRVIGIAQTNSTLQAVRGDLGTSDSLSGTAFVSNVPDLATMALGAINVLAQENNGFFVMIEGGAVDWMGHANNMPRFIEEQVDFNAAVDAVINWVEIHSSWDETLLIITADHECGGIWGEGTWTNSSGIPVALDRSNEALLDARYDPTVDTFNEFLAVQDNGVGELPGFMFASGNHTNDLVPLYAIGVGSERFSKYTRTDLNAAVLWGEQFNWEGHFVDITSVFDVMYSTIKDVKD